MMQKFILIGLLSIFYISQGVSFLEPEGVPAPGSSCNDWRTEEFDDGTVKTYCCVNCVKKYEFDEILPGSCCIGDNDNDNRRRLNPTPISRGKYWINGYIPYEIESTLPNQQRIHDAIAHWHSKTNIRLGPRNGESDYVRFIKDSSGCWSYLGRNGGQQEIGLADGCSAGTVVHEIGHALGMLHTQARHDRDLYINIDFANIPIDWHPQYNQASSHYDDCLRYDYESIMHYPAYFNGKKVITTINPPNSPIGNRDGLSNVDAVCMNSHYSLCQVALFQHDGFEGKEYSPFGSNARGVMDNMYNLNELNSLEFDNDQVSSMKIMAEPNTKCTVELYQHDGFDGWKATVIADNSNNNGRDTFMYSLSNLNSYGFVNDDMSSMKILAQSTCSITLYQHGDFTGTAYGPYTIGDYTLSHLVATGFVNDDVSSMKVSVLGGQKCIVDLYQHYIYFGWKATIIATNSNTGSQTFDYSLSQLQSAGFVNDDMSSMKIRSESVSSGNSAVWGPIPGPNGMSFNNNNIQMVFIIVIALLVINLCCMGYYYLWYNKSNVNNKKYKTVSFQSDTDEI